MLVCIYLDMSQSPSLVYSMTNRTWCGQSHGLHLGLGLSAQVRSTVQNFDSPKMNTKRSIVIPQKKR